MRGSGGDNGSKGGGPDKDPSFLLVNIARLITPSGRTKSGFLKDQAVANNSLFVGVTETWLTDGVFDSEVLHDFQGYSILRCDRGPPGGWCMSVPQR